LVTVSKRAKTIGGATQSTIGGTVQKAPSGNTAPPLPRLKKSQTQYMAWSALGIVIDMAKTIGGVSSRNGGKAMVGVAVQVISIGTTALHRKVHTRLAQGTTSHAMELALLGAKNTFGATIGTALGNIAVPEWKKSPSMPKRANPVLAVVTNAKSLTSIAQSLALLSFQSRKG